MSENTARFRAFAVSFFIGLLLPALRGAPAEAVIAAIVVAAILWTFATFDRKQPDIILPIAGLILGLVIALGTAPLISLPDAALWIVLLVLFA